MNNTDSSSPDHVVDSVAYDTSDKPYRNYSVRASYLKAPNDQDAWIEIFKDGTVAKSFYYPAYRIYNIAAHFQDIVDNEIEESEPHLTSDQRWIPLSERQPDSNEPTFLVTNNLDHRNAFGHRSHVWLVSMVHAQEGGEFCAFLEDDSRVRDLTHWASLREFLA